MAKLLSKLKGNYLAHRRMPYIKKMKEHLLNKDFSLISNNCFAGRVYQDLDLRYRSPTVGLYFFMPCYIKFLSDMKHYLCCPIEFVDKSIYDLGNKRYGESKIKYPIGSIKDIEVHFIHYKTKDEAKLKWYRRIERINFESLFIVASERDMCSDKLIHEFDNLPHSNKIFFTAHKYDDVGSSLYLSEFSCKGEVGDTYNYGHIMYKHFDFASWFNKSIYENISSDSG